MNLWLADTNQARYERMGVWYEVPVPVPLDQVIRGAILNALAYTDGDREAAAKLLGLTYRVLTYQMGTYNIPIEDARKRKEKE